MTDPKNLDEPLKYEKLVLNKDGVWEVPEPTTPTKALNNVGGKKMGRGKMAAYAMAAAAVVGLGVAGYKYFTGSEHLESGVVLKKDGDNKILKAEIVKSNQRFTSMALMNAFGEIQKGNGYETKAKTGLDMAATSAVLQTIQRNEKDFIGQLDAKGEAVATLLQPNPLAPRFEYKPGGLRAEDAAKGQAVVVKLTQDGFDFAVEKPDGKRTAMHFDNNQYAKAAFVGTGKEKAPAPKAPKPSNSGPS